MVLPKLFILAGFFSFTDKAFGHLDNVGIILFGVFFLSLFLRTSKHHFLLLFIYSVYRLLRFPEIANHELFLILVSGCYFFLHRRPVYFQALVRRMLGVVYLVGGMHKLNEGFFDPGLSCLSMLLPSSAAMFPVAPWFVTLVELSFGMVCLMASDRTFRLASPAFVLFHLILAPLGFWDFFSVAMLALFPSRELRLFGNVSLIIHVGLYALMNTQYFPWMFIALGLTAVVTVLSAMAWPQPQKPMPRSYWLMPAAVFIWGLGPYLGLAHYPTFSMFSNLQMNSLGSNSWIIKRPVFDVQESWWKVVSFQGPLKGLPYPDAHLIAQHPKEVRLPEGHLFGEKRIGKLVLEEVLTQQQKTWPDDFPLSARPSWLQKTFLSRRTITTNRCQW